MENPQSSAPEPTPAPAGTPHYDPQRIQKSLASLEKGQNVTASPLIGLVKRHPFWVAGGFFLAGILLQVCMSLAMQTVFLDSHSQTSLSCQKCGATKEITERPFDLHWFWISLPRIHGGNKNCAHEWVNSNPQPFTFWDVL